MKKKFIALVLSALVAFGLCACGGNSETGSTEPKQQYIVNGEEVSEEEYQEYLTEQQALQEEMEKSEELTPEEQFAADYLTTFSSSFKNPHSLELYHVWVYIQDMSTSDKDSIWYYVTYEYSAENDMGGRIEGVVGNKSPITVNATEGETLESVIEEVKALSLVNDGFFTSAGTKAQEKGEEVDADKILAAYLESL